MLFRSGARLVDTVRNRPAGRSAVAAFRSVVVDDAGMFDRIAAGDAEMLAQARATARVIVDSPTLLARERQTLHAVAASLAAVLSETETGDGTGDEPDPVAHAVANALMGVHLALLDYSRRRLLDDDRPETIAADLRHYGERALSRLERGLDTTPATEGPR